MTSKYITRITNNVRSTPMQFMEIYFLWKNIIIISEANTKTTERRNISNCLKNLFES